MNKVFSPIFTVNTMKVTLAGNSLVSVRLSFRAREEEILEDETGRGKRIKVLQNKKKSKSRAPEKEVKTC